MSNPFMEPRITSLEISMADLKEIVAETSRQMAQNSREIREMQEKSDRESAKFRADMNKMQEKSDRESAKFRADMNKMLEKSDGESAKFRADMNKMQEKSDREFSKFQKEMKDNQDRTDRNLELLSLEMKEKQDRTDRNLELLLLEMREDRKDLSREMKESKDRTDRVLKELSLEMKEGQDKLSQEMKEFKVEMQVWRDKKDQEIEEMRQERRQHNLEMGRIANRQGRMAEDFVAPSICRIMKEALGIDKKIPCIDNFRAKRAYRGDTSKIREFDVIAECLDYALVNETKSSPTPADVNELIESMGVIRDYFPEFKDRKLIGAIASLFLNTSLINYASAKGILALAVGDDLMDIKNPAGFKPSFW